jgi:hypothetical protein
MPPDAVNEHYLEHYRAHLASAGADPAPLPASFVAPAGFWTAADKARFFRALAAHSRLRPDLIARAVGTKTALDVRTYIAALDAASSASASASSSAPSCAPALDVSDDWIAFEDAAAASLTTAEPAWAARALDAARDAALRLRRAQLRAPRGSGTGARDRDRAGQEARRAAWAAWRDAREKDWARADVLAALGAPELSALDAVLRDGEERRAPRRDAVPGSAPGPGPPSRSATPEPAADIDADALAGLSPKHRRLLAKRLWMRRKRAAARGEAPSLALDRQKPGRKSKSRSQSQSEQVPAGDAEGEDEDEETEPEAQKRTPRKAPGLTKYSKLKTLFADLELDSAALHAQGLDLFRLSALGRLMQCVLFHIHIHRPADLAFPRSHTSPHSSEEPRLDACVVQHLYALTVAFTVSATRKALAFATQERRAKSRTKVWRKNPAGSVCVRPVADSPISRSHVRDLA